MLLLFLRFQVLNSRSLRETLKARMEREILQAHLERTGRHLKESRAEAERANQAKSEFLANMSFELRTPLNAIIGLSKMIQDEELGPIRTRRYLDYAADIHQSGQLLNGMINDVLDISKIESGQFVLNEEEIDLARTLNATITKTRGELVETGIHLKVAFPDPLPRLNADARTVIQMAQNLLSNAAKFTQEGGAVGIGAELADGGLSLWVSDTGIGMPHDRIARIQEPFGLLGDPLARRSQGIGLGLPLVRSLIGQHGGRMDVDSAVGVGTTVRLWFPPHRVVTPASRRTGADGA